MYSSRNDASFENIERLNDVSLSLESYEKNKWNKLYDLDNENNLIKHLTGKEFIKASFQVTKPLKYRISYEANDATVTTNTQYAITIDDIAVYGLSPQTNNVFVTYDFGFKDAFPLVIPYNKGSATDLSVEVDRYTYEFKGWYYNDELLTESIPVNEDIVLTAKWEKVESLITFDFGYLETNNIHYETVTNGSKLVEIDPPSREGYNFIAWYETFTNKDNHEPFDFSVNITEDVRLIAKWEKISEDISYNRDDEKLGTYYENIKDKNGKDLFLGLREIITNTHEPVNYGFARTALEVTDKHPYDSNKVLGIYDRDIYYGPWNHPIWEREHVWPNSKLGVQRAVNSTTNQASDLHNLRAIQPTVNQRRSNRYFVLPELSNHSPVGHIVGDGTYYPGDEDVGDVSRIFLYMVIRYDVLTLTDDHNLLRLGDLNQTNNEPTSAFMGKLSLLYDWHLKDPVDDFEIRRNELISEFQGNRNPFIDHPELFEEVYKYLINMDIENTKETLEFIVDDKYLIKIDYNLFKERKNKYVV